MKMLLNAQYDFMKHAKMFLFVSLVSVVMTAAILIGKGLDYGIDFNGGVLFDVVVKNGTSISNLRKKINSVKNIDVSLQNFGSARDILLRANINHMDPKNLMRIIKQKLAKDVLQYRRVEFVGPVVGKELEKAALYAFLSTLGIIMLYIWIRFEWQYGVAAVLGLLHDIFITVGLLAVLRVEFGLSVVAAILTIAGYSINDTVVIFDRIRENFSLHHKKSYAQIYNLSINQSLTRTVMTSSTTLIALLVLFIFGGPALRSFSLTMILGVVIGTYSSNCTSTPLLLWLKPTRDRDAFVDPIKKMQRSQ